MSMSKKHFEALAAALMDAKRHAQPFDPMIHESYVKFVAFECSKFNPNFDRTRFLTACGVEEEK